MRSTPLVALLLALLLTACRTDRSDPPPGMLDGEAATTLPPDAAEEVEGAVAAPGGVLDPERYRPERLDEARRVLLRDTDVLDGQVLLQQDTVRVTAVVEGLEGALARQKAEQLVALAARTLEAGPAPAGPATLLGPTVRPYAVVLRTPDGRTLYRGVKPAEADRLTDVP